MREKILVRGVNWIGDAVMTLPAIKALKKAHPGSHLSLLVKPSVAAIFEKDPSVDEIILYEEAGITGRMKLAHTLRRAGFSKAFLLQNAFDAALIAFLSGIPERAGYDRDGRGKLLTKRVPYNNEDRSAHHIDYYLDLLKACGIPAERTNPWIFLSIEERLSAREQLNVLRRPVLGINPGAAYGSAKRWLPSRFAEVAAWFTRDTKGSVVIFGGPSDAEVAHEIERLIAAERYRYEGVSYSSRESVMNLAGTTTLRRLIALIAECDVFLSNDSGPMHIAYAVGTPLVALFGSTSPVLTGPVGEGNVVMRPDLPCSPCFERTCGNNYLQCMHDILSEDVYLAVKGLVPEKRAVFFDRDGTLCEDVNYLSRREDFRPLPGLDRLALLKERGFRLIGVTNQSGIARGLVDERVAVEINTIFVERYGFDGFFYCPHLPEENCSCRKPEPGMLHDARRRYGIDLRRSYVVGDKDADTQLARVVGAKAVFVKTGQQTSSADADVSADGLKEAVDFILEDRKEGG
jgi:heptosyltransferase-2